MVGAKVIRKNVHKNSPGWTTNGDGKSTVKSPTPVSSVPAGAFTINEAARESGARKPHRGEFGRRGQKGLSDDGFNAARR